MKTIPFALVVAGSVIVGSLAAVMVVADDAERSEPLREHREVETTAVSNDFIRAQAAAFSPDGRSIHYYSKQGTNEDGSVVWRQEVSRLATSDPAAAALTNGFRFVEIIDTTKHGNRWAIKIRAKSPQDLYRQYNEWQKEGWAVVSASRWFTNEDGTLTQSLQMSAPKTNTAPLK